MPNAKKKNDVSRREFLTQAGVAIGGITLVSLSATTSSCSGSSSPPSDTTSKPPSGTVSNPPSGTTSKPSGPTFQPPANPPLMQIPDCDTYVALDRKYSALGTWVLPSQNKDIALIGISESLVKIAGGFRLLFICDTGKVLSAAREDAFGSIEGYKITFDLAAPISGTVMVTNHYNGGADFEQFDAYSHWLVEIKLSNPDELNKLYTPQYYAYLEAPKWSGPIPPMY